MLPISVEHAYYYNVCSLVLTKPHTNQIYGLNPNKETTHLILCTYRSVQGFGLEEGVGIYRGTWWSIIVK